MSGISTKKVKINFKIGLSQSDPLHIQVADILNQQTRYGKTQYIVDAIMHYIGCGLTESAAHPAKPDEKYIENIVNRILLERGGNNAGSLLTPARQVGVPLPSKPQNTNKIEFNETMETISEEGIKSVADALVAFRKK